HADLEIADPDAVRTVLGRLRPAVVVNTAAFHNVPKCETMEREAYLVHAITDYVFDGAKRAPYVETDRPNPLNVYAQSKLAGEYAVLSVGDRHQVVRSSGLYGLRPCRAKGGNFIDAMFRAARERPEVRVVDDEILTPTYTADLARQI